MARSVYVNGSYQSYGDALVHAEDRGFQFGDAVYEVIEVRSSQLVDMDRHLKRLDRSLNELSIAPPMSQAAWTAVIRETLRRNRVKEGSVYLQVSRGAGPRNFLFDGVETGPTVVCLARPGKLDKQQQAAEAGLAVVTCEDPRWARCDIKTVMLLPASLAKEQAKARGAQEAWFLDDAGKVLEGGSSNAWIITQQNEVVTRPADKAILRGVTRTTLIDTLEAAGLQFVERAFTLEEAFAAKEAFLTSATNMVMPIVKVDDQMIGDGKPGPVVAQLRRLFHTVASSEPIT